LGNDCNVVTLDGTQTLTNKSIAGSEINSGTVFGSYVAAVNLAAGNVNGGVFGNLPVANLNSGTSAGSTTFWRGDGTWAVPIAAASSITYGVTSVTNGTSGELVYNTGDLQGTLSTVTLPNIGVNFNKFITATLPPPLGYASQGVFQIIMGDVTPGGFQINSTSQGGTNGAQIFLASSNGGGTSPSVIINGSYLGSLQLFGYGGGTSGVNGGPYYRGGEFQCTGTQTWSPTASGTECQILTTPNGSISTSVAATFGQDKSLTLAGAFNATQGGSLGGTYSGNVTLSGNLDLSGLATGTQVSCLGLASGNAVVATSGACGSVSGPGGSNTQVQYNNSSAFGGISGVTSNGTAMTFANGDMILAGSTSGTLTIEATAIAGTHVITFPAATDTVDLIGTAQTFSATKTFADAGSWGSGGISDGVIAATTSLAVGGASIGSNALAVSGTTVLSSVSGGSTLVLTTALTDYTHNAIREVGTMNTASATTEVDGESWYWTASGSNSINVRAETFYLSGTYSGSGLTSGIQVSNNLQGTQSFNAYNESGNIGITGSVGAGFSTGTNTGDNVGLYGYSVGSSNKNIGTFGRAYNYASFADTANVGTAGVGAAGSNAGTEIGGIFAIGTTTTWSTTGMTAASAALIADNNGEAFPIFIGRANGTAQVQIQPSGGLSLGNLATDRGAGFINAYDVITQASGASSIYSQINIAPNLSSTTNQAIIMTNDTNGGRTVIAQLNSAATGATINTIANSTAIYNNTGAGLYLGSIVSGTPVVLFAGANAAITITSPTAIAFNHYTTAGLLQNDASGNITSNASGNVLGGTAYLTNLNVVGQMAVPNMTQSATAQSGTVCYNATAGAITYDASLGCLSSLEELKDIHGDIDGGAALGEIKRLIPFWFTPKDRPAGSDLAEQPGLGAHQVETVDKRLVGYGANGDLRGVRYSEIVAVLIAAVKQQQVEIEKLKIVHQHRHHRHDRMITNATNGSWRLMNGGFLL
jgi:hypothetical protein